MTNWKSMPVGMRCALATLRGRHGWATASSIRTREATLLRLERLGLAARRTVPGRTEWIATEDVRSAA